MSSTALHLGLSTLFIRKGLLSEELISIAIRDSRKSKQSLVSTLITTKRLSAREIAELCYEDYVTPLLDLNEFDLNSISEDLLNKKLM